MNCDIYEKVICFHNLIGQDPNHRNKSWEHCYQYFLNDKSNYDNDTAALHLAVYLASWGMYRPSSFLLQKDYKIHCGVVKKIIEYQHLRGINFSSLGCNELSKTLNEIICLSDCIKKYYPKKIKKVDGERKTVNVTDTLATKIMFGTLGCIPAYDTYCVAGMRESNIKYSKISVSNLRSVVDFYTKHEKPFNDAQKTVNKKSGMDYPIMKILDMYFWRVGFMVKYRK